MYRKPDRIITKKINLSNYVNGYDLYNSALIHQLTNPDIPREEYVINNYEYRPDLIAEEIYGSTEYLGLLLITQATPLNQYKKGVILSIIPKKILDGIIESM